MFLCPHQLHQTMRLNSSTLTGISATLTSSVCHCDNPCTTSSCGRMIYVYPEKSLRAYPGVERNSKEWDETYTIIVNVEKSITLRTVSALPNKKQQTKKTLHPDLLPASISQLLTVVVADKINKRQHIRSLKSLIA